MHHLLIMRARSLGCAVGLLAACVFSANTARAQRAPRISYVYPAGGKQGTVFEVQVGGQYLDGPTGVVASGPGIQVEILGHDKQPSQQIINDVRERLRDMQAKMREIRKAGKMPETSALPTIRRLMTEADLEEKDLRMLAEYDRKRNDPKQQQNAQIAEVVRVQVSISADAEPGLRQLRLRTTGGLSNPMRFVVGQHPEIREADLPLQFDFEHYNGSSAPSKKSGKASSRKMPLTPTVSLPVTINGQILPGQVDKFTFRAAKGNQVVLAVQARNLIPYLADAVPGWFQAVVSLHDAAGQEVAFADGYRFDPDPVLFYKIPEDGDYQIVVRDSIYRGREDFVYRITVGELPFLTGISPLGTKAGSKVDLLFLGGNLGGQNKQRYTAPDRPGIVSLHATRGPWFSNFIPFQIDTLGEEPEREPNNGLGSATEVKPPLVVNGRIETPADVDYFRFRGPGNKLMSFEIFARRLGSPLDSSLTVFDINGKKLAFNDDHEDPTAGLSTHHADARILLKLPETGECFVRVADTQNQGGYYHAYRLKIRPAQPGFALRITPSTINAKAGGTAKLTVHAYRIDDFNGEIKLQLKDTSGSFQLKNAKVPAGKDVADISITVSETASEKPQAITIQGKAEVNGHSILVNAEPAEDMMQAFIYRHLVPVDELLVDVHASPAK